MIDDTSDLILASSSEVRSKILKNAGVRFSVHPANVDESHIKKISSKMPVETLAGKLAVLKAQEVSEKFSTQMVIGADQILECEGVLFDKPLEHEEARRSLLKLQGKTHQLISSVCVVVEGKTIWSRIDGARLTMLNLSSNDIDQYLNKAGSSVFSCVGAYRLEDIGIQLFKKIEGDYFTILGLPLLPLLDFLRTGSANDEDR